MEMHSSSRKAFTLIEVLAAIAIIAILAIVVVLTINPLQLLKQGRDANRVSDMTTINKAVALYHEDAMSNPSTMFLGTSSIIYLSVPDPTATTTAGTNCSGLGLGLPATGYHCPASSTYRNINGTGWIPIDFASSTFGTSLGALPVDPLNTTSSGEYYEYTNDGVGDWETASVPESQKYSSLSAGFVSGPTSTLLATWDVAYTTSTYTVGSGGYPGNGNTILTFDPNTNSIWVIGNSASGTVTQINDTTYASTTYTVGSNPTSIAFDSNTNSVWVPSYGGGTVTQINDTTHATSTYTFGGANNSIEGIAFDPNTNSLWLTSTNAVLQINDTTYVTSTPFQASYEAPWGIIFDSHTNSLWTKIEYSGLPTISPRVINDTTNTTTWLGAPSFYTMAFDPHTNSLWLTGNGSDNVDQLNDTSYAISTTTLSFSPYGIAFDPHTDSIWLTNFSGNSVAQINDTTYAINTYGVGCSPTSIAFDSHTNSIWVTCSVGGSTITNNVIQLLPNH